MLRHDAEERSQLADWLLANQLTKDKKLVSLIATWEKNPSPILRRLFWYHQARLRWVGQAPPGNSADLLDSLENNMANAEPEVQWAMNFCAGQIGVHEPEFRSRCIKLGEALGSTRTSMLPKTVRRRTFRSLSESKSPSDKSECDQSARDNNRYIGAGHPSAIVALEKSMGPKTKRE